MLKKTGRIITGVVVFLIILLIDAPEGSEIICSSKPVETIIGQDVTLLCHLEPPVDATDMTVEWHHGYRNDVVHMYRGRKDNPVEQTERYEGRTSLFREGLTKGNLSLKLSSFQLTDSGRYKCFSRAKNIRQSCYVNLTVVTEPEKRISDITEPEKKIGDSDNAGAAAGIVISVLVLIALVVFAVWWKYKNNRQERGGRNRQNENNPEEEGLNMEEMPTTENNS